jgi:hypothetical protein
MPIYIPKADNINIEKLNVGKRKYYIICANKDNQTVAQFGYTEKQFERLLRQLEWLDNLNIKYLDVNSWKESINKTLKE